MLVICSNHEIILRITWRLDSSGAVLNDEFSINSIGLHTAAYLALCLLPYSTALGFSLPLNLGLYCTTCVEGDNITLLELL